MSEKNKKNISQVRASAELRALVNKSLEEQSAMEKALVASGQDEQSAKLKVAQLYFKNLEMAGAPVAMMQKTLAELATRIELDRIINPEQDLVSEKYRDLIELQMKAITALNKLGEKSISAKVLFEDDAQLKAPTFIDVETD